MRHSHLVDIFLMHISNDYDDNNNNNTHNINNIIVKDPQTSVLFNLTSSERNEKVVEAANSLQTQLVCNSHIWPLPSTHHPLLTVFFSHTIISSHFLFHSRSCMRSHSFYALIQFLTEQRSLESTPHFLPLYRYTNCNTFRSLQETHTHTTFTFIRTEEPTIYSCFQTHFSIRQFNLHIEQ